jgi:hypothetical protein
VPFIRMRMERGDGTAQAWRVALSYTSWHTRAQAAVRVGYGSGLHGGDARKGYGDGVSTRHEKARQCTPPMYARGGN